VENDRNKIAANSEHGCSLDERSRIQVLKAMGIQPWFSKYASVQVTEKVQQSVDTPAVESNSVLDVRELSWQQLQQTISECQLCELHVSRTQTIFGMGNPSADLMIITEAPDKDEDRTGEPFVGSVGQLLDAMLKAIGLNRENVFITNVIKCTPPDDRKPHVSEIVCCDGYLQRQIELVQPKLILALGRIAAHHLLVTKEALGVLREKSHSYNGIPLVVSYHPDYLIRKPIEKRKSWQDLLQVKHMLGK